MPKMLEPEYQAVLISILLNVLSKPLENPKRAVICIFVPAVLTSVSLTFVYGAISIFSACIGQFFTDGPFEETFAALTRIDTIMFSRSFIFTNRA